MGDLSSNVVCGDCSASDPEWASLNRGIFLCKECCFIHRSLGPQYSRIKALDETWNASLQKTVMTLASGAANHVWEHLLRDPGKLDLPQKQPSPNDPLETVKRKFIQLKHFQHQFVLRPSPADSFDIRNQELHSTVRTGALETTLRLLATGADPNFFHPEKGTRPLHVAARNGQALQVELLFLHGAHTDAPDYLGQTAVEHAMAAGHKALAQRIIELRYDLTDRLSFFACGEAPDHSTKHILIPNIKTRNSTQELAIKKLSPHVLEQLAADLYDEVDRRHTENILAKSPSDQSRFSIAFLPVNPNYPSVRNQTRQKFARLADDELAALVTVVLMESKRRHCSGVTDFEMDKDIFVNCDNENANNDPLLPKLPIIVPIPAVPGHVLTEDDNYPLYDSVASDDDLVLTEQQTLLAQQHAALEEIPLSSSNLKPVSCCDVKDETLVTKLAESEAKIQELQDSNRSLKLEIVVLQQMVGSIIHENLDLRAGVRVRNGVAQSSTSSPTLLVNGSTSNNGYNYSNGMASSQHQSPVHLPVNGAKPKLLPRPASMCDPSALRHFEQDHGLPARPSTTPELSRLQNEINNTCCELVQITTRKIVKLIKILVDLAQSNDFVGIQSTSSKIYDVAQEMGSVLLAMDIADPVKDALRNVLFQVLRMKTEVSQLSHSTSSNSNNAPESQNGSVVQKVKQVCFDVGAAMKRLMSASNPMH